MLTFLKKSETARLVLNNLIKKGKRSLYQICSDLGIKDILRDYVPVQLALLELEVSKEISYSTQDKTYYSVLITE